MPSQPWLDLRAPGRLLRSTPDLRFLLGAGLVSMTGDWLLIFPPCRPALRAVPGVVDVQMS